MTNRKSLVDEDGWEWPSVASFIYTSIEQWKSRGDITKTLMANGYSKKQSIMFYDVYLTRYRNRQMDILRKEGVAI
jgi:hypothetical protein